MTDLISTAFDLQSFCEQQGWQFCFIGGLAVQVLAEPRLTRDADMTLLTGFGCEEHFIDTLLSRYQPRRPDARQFALLHRVLLLKAPDGTGLDIALGALPFEEEAVARSRKVPFADGLSLRICTAEDLIVMKAFASRDQDWRDVEMTIHRSGASLLDWPYILRQLTPLAEAKEEPAILQRLLALKSNG